MTDPPLNDKQLLSQLETHTLIYKILIRIILNNDAFKHENKSLYINNCCNFIDILNKTLNKLNSTHIQLVYVFSTLLTDKQINVSEVFKLLDEFATKLTNKTKINQPHIKNKIYNCEINNFSDLSEAIDWILMD